MTGATLQALWSHWRRNPLQLFTLLAGLVLATALWCGVQAVNAEARASYDAAAATLGEGRFDQLLSTDGSTIAQDTYIALRRAGWQLGPVLEGALGQLRLVGIDPLTAPAGFGGAGQGEEIDLADFFRAGPIFANAETAAELRALTDRPIRIDPNIAPGTALTDIGVAQDLLGQPGVLSRLVVGPEQPVTAPPLADLAPQLTRQSAGAEVGVGRLTDSFHLNLTAFGLLSFAVGMFIVHGAIGLAFEQRRALVRTLRALGVPLARIIALVVGELLVIAVIGGLVGVILGYVIAAVLLPDVAATLRGLYGADVSGNLQLRPVWWVSGLAIAVLGTGLAASGALAKVARLPLLASGQSRAWAMASGKARRLQGAVAIRLVAASGIFAIIGDGLLAGFLLLACLLIGAALALPLVLDLLLGLVQSRASAAKWQWFWADTRQQLPGLSLALMALLLAMAANIGVATMVSSFRVTFVEFLDQRLSSELYISAASEAQSPALEAFAASRAREVLPVVWVETRLADLPGELYGARVGPTFQENWRFLDSTPTAWDAVANGAALVINEQLARRAGLWVGDTLAIGQGMTLPVVGVFGDYGNPIGQAIVSEALFQQLHPGVIATRFGLRTDDPDALREALTQEFGLPEANVIDQAGIKAVSLSVFERTFTVTDALNVLTLAVAGFSIFMSLLTLAAMRVPQLAPAWALGLTRAELGRLELLRAVVLAVLTAVLAIPLGLALAWVLLAIVNVEAFGWRLPMFLFPADYATLGLFALVAAVIAAGWPAWRLARTPPAELLQVFAHER